MPLKFNPITGKFDQVDSKKPMLLSSMADLHIGTTPPSDPVAQPYWLDISVDTQAPVIKDFSLPDSTGSLDVMIKNFTATDNDRIAGYYISEDSTVPTLSSNGWTENPPFSYSFTYDGDYTLYAWVKDEAGNISEVASASVSIDSGNPRPQLYTVNVSTDSHVSVDKPGANILSQGDSITITPSIDNGYYGFVSLDGAMSQYVTNKFIISNISADHSVVYTSEVIPAEPNLPFTDEFNDGELNLQNFLPVYGDGGVISEGSGNSSGLTYSCNGGYAAITYASPIPKQNRKYTIRLVIGDSPDGYGIYTLNSQTAPGQLDNNLNLVNKQIIAIAGAKTAVLVGYRNAGSINWSINDATNFASDQELEFTIECTPTQFRLGYGTVNAGVVSVIKQTNWLSWSAAGVDINNIIQWLTFGHPVDASNEGTRMTLFKAESF